MTLPSPVSWNSKPGRRGCAPRPARARRRGPGTATASRKGSFIVRRPVLKRESTKSSRSSEPLFSNSSSSWATRSRSSGIGVELGPVLVQRLVDLLHHVRQRRWSCPRRCRPSRMDAACSAIRVSIRVQELGIVQRRSPRPCRSAAPRTSAPSSSEFDERRSRWAMSWPSGNQSDRVVGEAQRREAPTAAITSRTAQLPTVTAAWRVADVPDSHEQPLRERRLPGTRRALRRAWGRRRPARAAAPA